MVEDDVDDEAARPCPFCGANVEVDDPDADFDDEGWFHTHCANNAQPGRQL